MAIFSVFQCTDLQCIHPNSLPLFAEPSWWLTKPWEPEPEALKDLSGLSGTIYFSYDVWRSVDAGGGGSVFSFATIIYKWFSLLSLRSGRQVNIFSTNKLREGFSRRIWKEMKTLRSFKTTGPAAQNGCTNQSITTNQRPQLLPVILSFVREETTV